MRKKKQMMMVAIFFFTVGFFLLTQRAEAPQDSFWTKVNAHIPASSGLQVRRLYDEVAEITGPDGFVHRVNLADAGEWARTLRAAGDTAKKTIEIHIPDLDTTGFAQRFRKVATVPVGRSGTAAKIIDMDQDGLAEVVGIYDDFDFVPIERRIYEKVSTQSDSFALAFADFPDSLGSLMTTGDINDNGLPELFFQKSVTDSIGNLIATDVVLFESDDPAELAPSELLRHRIIDKPGGGCNNRESLTSTRTAIWIFFI